MSLNYDLSKIKFAVDEATFKRAVGVDDSNGTVGGFMGEVVQMLKEFAQIDSDCIKAFKSLLGRETCFDWEEPLVRILDDGIYA
jgi:hypothetical protein